MSETHKQIRDEQFWYTAAVVGFNTLVIKKDASALPAWFLLLASAAISLFGLHLVLARWVRDAVDGSRIAAPPFNNQTATALQRARYTLWEVCAYARDLGYILAELSGTLFYTLLIIATLVGVIIRCCG
jgi:hypothetical protein